MVNIDVIQQSTTVEVSTNSVETVAVTNSPAVNLSIATAGVQGASGQAGPAGPTGPASTVPGPAGPEGPTGPAGTNGVDAATDVMRVVIHGTNAAAARPSGALAVYWVGTVEPTNATNADQWEDGV